MASLSFDLARTSRDPGWNATSGLAHDALWQQAVTLGRFTTDGTSLLQTVSTAAGTGFSFDSAMGDVDFHSLSFAAGGTLGAARATTAPLVSLDWADDQTATLTLNLAWNAIKNAEVSAFTGTGLTLVNWVDAWVHLADDVGRSITLDGAKRGEVSTGAGNDTITIAVESNNAGWTNEFLIQSGGGDDVIIITSTSSNRTGGAYLGGWTHVTIEAGDGNDTVYGWGSDDKMDGGAGTDQFRLSGVKPGYIITTLDGVTTIRDIDLADGDDGTDTLSNVETLLFGDGSTQRLIAPPLPLPEGAEAYFGAPGDQFIDAGDGYDGFVLAGNRSQYELRGGGGDPVTIRDLTGDGGFDTLVNFERLIFADLFFDVSATGVFGGEIGGVI